MSHYEPHSGMFTKMSNGVNESKCKAQYLGNHYDNSIYNISPLSQVVKITSCESPKDFSQNPPFVFDGTFSMGKVISVFMEFDNTQSSNMCALIVYDQPLPEILSMSDLGTSIVDTGII